MTTNPTLEMEILIILTGIFCFFATLIPFIPSKHWSVRVFDFPRSQIAALTLVCLVAATFFFPMKNFWQILFYTSLMAVLLYQVSIIFTYTPFARKQVLTETNPENSKCNISLLSANVLMYNKNSEKLLSVIEQFDPDVIILMETNKRWQMEVSSLRKKYSYCMEEPLENTYGMLFYSRYKMINPEVKYIINPLVPSIHTKVELPSGDIIKIYVIHPEPPSPTENETSIERDGELLQIGKMAAKDKIPVIVIGDLNDVSWSQSSKLFQKISELLDPRVGRGFFNTFNANYFFLRWPLDYIFHSHHFKLIKMKRLPYIYSDHFPTFTQLALNQHAPYEQEKPHATAKDRAQAEKAIKAAKEM